MKRRWCDVAEEVLRETDNPSVGWGDFGLLDLIAERAGQIRNAEHPLARHRRILNALSRQPGNLVRGYFRAYQRHNRLMRIFWLPERAPNSGETS